MDSPEVTDLKAQIADLRIQIGYLSQQPRWPRMLLEWSRPPSIDIPEGNIVNVLSYHERNLRKQASVYYVVFGALYLSAGLSILIGSSNSTAILPHATRLFIALFYFLVSFGNVSCIFFPAYRYQVGMVFPTIGAAIAVCVINVTSSLVLHNIGAAITSLVFWYIIVLTHIAFATSIRGRVSYREFTLQLIVEAKEQQRKGAV